MSMTAVAQPTSYSSGLNPTRNGWTNGSNSAINLNAMSSDDLQRMLVPKKSPRRTNSSSSLSSTSSASSTTSTATMQANGQPAQDPAWNPRKKPITRGFWPASKAEPVSGLSTARTQSAVAGSTLTAASGLSALHQPNSVLSSQHIVPPHSQTNGMPRSQSYTESPAILYLAPMNGTFERKTINVPFGPEALKIGRQTNQKTFPTPLNGFFDSKVLSRQHAEVWADRDGKIWIRDVKSSNGTFVNGKRLSQENRDSEPHVLKEGDLLELGIDIVSEDQKTVVHHKVAAKVENAGLYGYQNGFLEMGFGDSELPNSGPMLQHAAPGVRRSLSQASNASGGRLVQNSIHAAYNQKWLQPVTMEQIVRRLNTELRDARVQSQDLRVTSNFVDAVLMHAAGTAEEGPRDHAASEGSPTKGQEVKARFAMIPPAPPPSQPLPEKPQSLRNRNLEHVISQPQLRRSDTEKPKAHVDTELNGSLPHTKGDSSGQILSLIEALRNAEREISSQAERLHAMESALQQEREARGLAEERAGRLEQGSSSEVTPLTSGVVENDLQSRLDTMKATYDEMKLQMESYKQRAEGAEAESKRDRQSLAEMIESIRRRADADKKRYHVRSRSTRESADLKTTVSTNGATAEDENTEHTPIDDSFSDEELDGEIESVLDKHQNGSHNKGLGPTFANGAPLSPLSDAQLKELSSLVSTAADSLRNGGHVLNSNGVLVRQSSQQIVSRGHERMVQSAPYVSIIGVIFVGVGVMAWLNGWQKPDR